MQFLKPVTSNEFREPSSIAAVPAVNLDIQRVNIRVFFKDPEALLINTCLIAFITGVSSGGHINRVECYMKKPL